MRAATRKGGARAPGAQQAGTHQVLLRGVHVHRHNAGLVGLVDGVGSQLIPQLDLLLRGQVLRHGALLAAFGQVLGRGHHLLHYLLWDALLARGRCGGRGSGTCGGTRGCHLRQLGLGGRQGIARLVPLAHQPGNDTASRVVLVQRLRQLLPQRLHVLLLRVRIQHQRIPLVLEQRQHAGNTRGAGRAWRHGLVA